MFLVYTPDDVIRLSPMFPSTATSLSVLMAKSRVS